MSGGITKELKIPDVVTGTAITGVCVGPSFGDLSPVVQPVLPLSKVVVIQIYFAFRRPGLVVSILFHLNGLVLSQPASCSVSATGYWASLSPSLPETVRYEYQSTVAICANFVRGSRANALLAKILEPYFSASPTPEGLQCLVGPICSQLDQDPDAARYLQQGSELHRGMLTNSIVPGTGCSVSLCMTVSKEPWS